MAVKKIELKVSIHSQECKTKLLKTVAKLQGIDQVSADSAKEILTVVGEVDPVLVTTQLRKKGMFAEIISVGPPKKPDSKPDTKLEACCYPRLCPCYQCQAIAVPVCYPPYDNRNACSFM